MGQSGLGRCGQRGARLMNLVCIMLDTLRYDHIAALGKQWVHTPNLDRFAGEAAVFERAYVGSFPTIPCRTDLFTGRYTFPHRGWSPLPREEPVLATLLRGAGYTSQLIVDTYHMLKDGYHFDRGFDGWEFIRGQENDRYIVDASLAPTPPAPMEKMPRLGDRYLRNVAGRRVEEDWFAPQVMRAAVRWLERNRGLDRFLLWVDCFDPHQPWDPPRHYVDLYDPGYQGDEVIYPTPGPVDYLTPAEMRHVQALYAGEVTMVDRWVGEVLGAIDRLGHRGDTLVVVMSDHGCYMNYPGDQGRVEKPWPLYEAVAHEVLLLRHPEGWGAGRRFGQLVQPVDLLPTLLEAAGVPAPAPLEGQSLLDLLRPHGGPRDWGRRVAVSCPYRQGPTLTTDRWSLVYQADRPAHLFDLRADPVQAVDLAAAHPEVVGELAEAFRAFLVPRNPAAYRAPG